jgi:hypothetical protein
MARYLFIVSRDRMDFFRDLRERFADDVNVEVIVDRRKKESDEAPPRSAPDRRVRPELDEELQSRAYAIVSFP